MVCSVQNTVNTQLNSATVVANLET